MLDLAEEWRSLNKVRRAPDSAEHWNNRSKTYAKGAPDSYVQTFIDYMNLSDRKLILDVGCGTGSLAVPLALAGHGVIAMDFSPGMLERLRDAARTAGIHLIENAWESTQFHRTIHHQGDLLSDALCEQDSQSVSNVQVQSFPFLQTLPREGGFIAPVMMSWQDDWSARGLYEHCVDIAIASRSIITADLEESLKKISSVAREAVYVTAATGISPRVDPLIAQVMGVTLKKHNDALFVFGIASDLGYEPTVNYIHSPRTKVFATQEEAFRMYKETLNYVDDHAEQVSEALAAARLRDFLKEHLISCGEGWCLDRPRLTPWAFIGWKV